MITEQQLRRLHPRQRPFFHWLVQALLAGNLKRVTITMENQQYIPRDRAVIFAMNHTDRFNYVPIMVHLWNGYRSIAPWVKGKYYQNALMTKLLDATNNIPVPSRGYIITKDFKEVLHRRPDKTEYRLLRDFVDGKISAEDFHTAASDTLRQYVSTPHGDFDPSTEIYDRYIQARYQKFMRMVATLSERTLQKENVSLLIFPEGTRSKRLTPGHPGIAQIALKTGVPVIPVGCNGSDKLYPGSSPLARPGTVTYRIGEPLTLEGALAPFAIAKPFEPFTRETEIRYGETFQAATDLIMARINDLLDPEYQFAGDTHGVSGDSAARFV